MTAPRTRPPFDGDERAVLMGWYQLQRDIVRWKCEGLSEADAHRAVLPASPLMTLAGLVSHLRWVEYGWFEVMFLGGPADGPGFADEDDLDFAADGRALADLLAEYEQQCRRSDEIIAAHALDEPGRHSDYPAAGASLRWMIVHMIEETARHAGHADAIRELLDSEVGYY
jgi:uncharacterized damage-inducible protein DinB